MRNQKIIRRKEGVTIPTRTFSKMQEDRVAKSLGGKRQPNSGATPFEKSDVKTSEFLLECKTKTTLSNSISIRKDVIDKLEKEALFMGKPYTALVINFGPNTPNYYVISEEVFKTFIKE